MLDFINKVLCLSSDCLWSRLVHRHRPNARPFTWQPVLTSGTALLNQQERMTAEIISWSISVVVWLTGVSSLWPWICSWDVLLNILNSDLESGEDTCLHSSLQFRQVLSSSNRVAAVSNCLEAVLSGCTLFCTGMSVWIFRLNMGLL